jgi:hypothetical protein
MGGLLIAAIGSGQLISKTGRYKVFPIVGTAVTVIGLYLLSLMDADTSVATASLYMFVLGLGLGLVIAGWAATSLDNPDARPWEQPGWAIIAVISQASLVALSLSLGGLGFILVDRFDTPIFFVAEIGSVGGILSVLGAYSALFLLPGASFVVVLYLARIHAIGWSLAVIHAASAPGLVLGMAAYSNTGLVGIAAAFILVYCTTWVAIGLELLGGLPQGRPAASTAS